MLSYLWKGLLNNCTGLFPWSWWRTKEKWIWEDGSSSCARCNFTFAFTSSHNHSGAGGLLDLQARYFNCSVGYAQCSLMCLFDLLHWCCVRVCMCIGRIGSACCIKHGQVNWPSLTSLIWPLPCQFSPLITFIDLCNLKICKMLCIISLETLWLLIWSILTLLGCNEWWHLCLLSSLISLSIILTFPQPNWTSTSTMKLYWCEAHESCVGHWPFLDAPWGYIKHLMKTYLTWFIHFFVQITCTFKMFTWF